MENLAREKEYEKSRSNEERLHRTAERTDQILVRLNDLSTKELTLKENVRDLESRLGIIESKQVWFPKILTKLFFSLKCWII